MHGYVTDMSRIRSSSSTEERLDRMENMIKLLASKLT